MLIGLWTSLSIVHGCHYVRKGKQSSKVERGSNCGQVLPSLTLIYYTGVGVCLFDICKYGIAPQQPQLVNVHPVRQRLPARM